MVFVVGIFCSWIGKSRFFFISSYGNFYKTSNRSMGLELDDYQGRDKRVENELKTSKRPKEKWNASKVNFITVQNENSKVSF